jgi:integrase
MAIPRKTKNGTWIVTAQNNRQRKTITIGKVSPPNAKLFAANLELLVSCSRENKSPTPQLEAWCESLSKQHLVQLAELGLIDSYSGTLTVDDLIEKFLENYERRSDIAKSTKIQFRSTMAHRVPDFLKDKTLEEIEPKKSSIRRFAKPQFSESAKSLFLKVESWERNHFAKSTWSKTNGRLREIGHWAVEQGIVDYNPFILLPKPGEVGEIIEIPAETILDVMDQCLDPDTRLLFALGRFGAFRIPKEARSLKPSSFDFDKKIIRILDCKKLRTRQMPMFEILERELIRHQQESPWSRYILSRRTLSTADANNYNLMKEAVVRAGYEPWADLRRNLRSSAVNDFLEAGHPENKVVAWVGHSVAVSRKHYQQQSAKSMSADAVSMDWG